ncbi:MAG: hypothetical protein JOZ27_04020 [Caulobacteraceae bacterium]|nr:hypothetical protein [Caulobacteraceae bacterium]
MADPITELAEAEAAYQAALDATAKAQGVQEQLALDDPIDQDAYSAALSAVAAAQGTSQQAQAVYQAAILDTPDVAALRADLTARTGEMKARCATLAKEAATLNALATAANDVASVLGAISKYVAL